jgi:hypothetical protein
MTEGGMSKRIYFLTIGSICPSMNCPILANITIKCHPNSLSRNTNIMFGMSPLNVQMTEGASGIITDVC